FFVTVHAASSMAGDVRRSARLSIGWSSIMTVVVIATQFQFRVQWLDDAAGEDQAGDGQQNQAHAYFSRGGSAAGCSVVGGSTTVPETVLTTTVDVGAAIVGAGAGGVIGDLDASVIAPGKARSSAAVRVCVFFGSSRLLDRPTSVSACGKACTTCCIAVDTTSEWTCGWSHPLAAISLVAFVAP